MTEQTILPEGVRSLRTLLIDDDVFMLALLEEMLRGLGFNQITLATDGKEALVSMDAMIQPAQLLICDLNMPGMDGIEFFRHLAARKFNGWMIISSGSDIRLLKTVGSLIQAHQLHLLGSLHKPFQQDQLVSTLLRLLTQTVHPDYATITEELSPEEIATGLRAGYLEVFFQPQVSVLDKRVTGVECLARWRHPTKGLIAPSAFIAVAEEHGLIDELTIVVFRQAMQHLGNWTRQGHALRVSVNISMNNLEQLDMPEQFAEITRQAGVDVGNIMLEMTESRLMNNLAASLEVITRLSLMGFGLSIDDFGTGYSNMEKLNQLPFTELKVDHAFVSGASRDAAARAIFELSVQIGRALNIYLVAEGVETQEHWELVEALGCDDVQGYLVAAPMPADEFIQWKIKWEAAHKT